MDNQKSFHSRSIHNKEYDFDELIKAHHPLAQFVKMNKYRNLSLDYANASAVQALNQAILNFHYQIRDWCVPKNHLCPPIPGRADYIHHIADLLAEPFAGNPPIGTKVKGLDIGTGTSCIYPILGNSIYGWKFVGSDICSNAINHAKTILNANPKLKKNIKFRFQKSTEKIFEGIIKPDEKFDFSMCNPPFYASKEEANDATLKKIKNLNKNKIKKGNSPIEQKLTSNFGGVNAELWCHGAEKGFITRMIKESVQFKEHCNWFTSLVSNKENLIGFQTLLKELNAQEIRIIQMNHGQKISHIFAWKL